VDPANGGPRRDAKIINISADPLTTRYPFKEIEADLLVQGDPARRCGSCARRSATSAKRRTARRCTRRKTVATAREENAGQAQEADRERQGPVAGPPRLSRPLPQPGKEQGRIVVSELGVPLRRSI
jgi:hypothetical protein